MKVKSPGFARQHRVDVVAARLKLRILYRSGFPEGAFFDIGG